MIRREVIARLQNVGYQPDLTWSPDTLWHHPEEKFVVQVHYGGKVTIWFRVHPKHWAWSSLNHEYVDRRKNVQGR